MRTRFGLILLLVLLGQACSRPAAPADGLSREQFVELFVSLRNAKKSARSPTEFEEKKRQLFAKAQLTEAQFKGFADAHSEDVSFMAAVWDSVQHRLDRGDTSAQSR